MIFIFAQRGATSLGFQLGRAEISLVYPRYWGRFPYTLGHCHWWGEH